MLRFVYFLVLQALFLLSATGSPVPYPVSSAHSKQLATTTPIRGVNIGGWLLLEKWLNQDLFLGTDADDQWSFDSTFEATTKLRLHWDTFFTEADVALLSSWGINALRIPIGYWAYDNNNTPYIQGADEYLRQALLWARQYGMMVLIDCHGSPGSQNGFSNSGRSGDISWQSDDNLQRSIDVLVTMAQKYGTPEYADVVLGLELTNEPASWSPNDFSVTQSWAKKAYSAVQAAATHPEFNVFMHDSFKGPANWTDVGSALNGNATRAQSNFWIDVHLYQNQQSSDDSSQTQHISKACGWSQTELLPSADQLPVVVGEFSAQTNICVDKHGTLTAGTSCNSHGCQCSASTPIELWSQPLKDATQKFVEAQLQTFEEHSMGWFIWTYKGPGAWGLQNLVQNGLIGNPVTDRSASVC